MFMTKKGWIFNIYKELFQVTSRQTIQQKYEQLMGGIKQYTFEKKKNQPIN